MPIRNQAFVGQATTLTIQILKNGIAFTPYQTTKVEFYGSLTDAQNNTNSLGTTTTILNLGGGVYQYTSPVLNTSKTYYDKFYFIDSNGNPEQSKMAEFFVNQYTIATPEDTTNKVYLTGKLLDSASNPLKSVEVILTLDDNSFITNQNILLVKKPLKIRTNNFGEFGIWLYKNKTYKVEFKNTYLEKYNKIITIPDVNTPLNFETA